MIAQLLAEPFFVLSCRPMCLPLWAQQRSHDGTTLPTLASTRFRQRADAIGDLRCRALWGCCHGFGSSCLAGKNAFKSSSRRETLTKCCRHLHRSSSSWMCRGRVRVSMPVFTVTFSFSVSSEVLLTQQDRDCFVDIRGTGGHQGTHPAVRPAAVCTVRLRVMRPKTTSHRAHLSLSASLLVPIVSINTLQTHVHV